VAQRSWWQDSQRVTRFERLWLPPIPFGWMWCTVRGRPLLHEGFLQRYPSRARACFRASLHFTFSWMSAGHGTKRIRETWSRWEKNAAKFHSEICLPQSRFRGFLLVAGLDAGRGGESLSCSEFPGRRSRQEKRLEGIEFGCDAYSVKAPMCTHSPDN